MIVVDTHIWVWWVHGDASLPASIRSLLESAEQTGIAVSAISCWEVAKLVERGRLTLPCPVFDWLQQALSYPASASSSCLPASASSPRSFRASFTATLPTRLLSPRLAFSMPRS
jgi:PIN domain nuclease of toxin-antitoxin system